eukprot:TRINITY_DN251_c0_g1_i1.p1 TRINITY_DN251_c0_g1~~TRINITY_DN251_c0_g1_i1.p1  ORF type:complete len:205 (+),score=49.05 TRINITY_DN251_c0_g1_i1:90-704(+)
MANDCDVILKLLVVGESGVGKSCLTQKYVEGAFSETFLSTIGVDFKLKTIRLFDKRVKLQIWDTAGQERYRTIVKSFYRGTDGIVLAFDLTNSNSFLQIQFWLTEITKMVKEKTPVILVGTKSDLHKKRAVHTDQALATASKHGLQYVETSAKEGTNIDKAFEMLATEVYKANSVRTEHAYFKHKTSPAHEAKNIHTAPQGGCC